MPPALQEMQNDLNKLYWTDSKKYQEHLAMIKGMGYRVFRNPQGLHKIELDMSSTFGGIFNGFFKRRWRHKQRSL